jgi:hypothetical protein
VERRGKSGESREESGVESGVSVKVIVCSGSESYRPRASYVTGNLLKRTFLSFRARKLKIKEINRNSPGGKESIVVFVCSCGVHVFACLCSC